MVWPCLALLASLTAQTPPWRNASVPFGQRAANLVSQLTLDEKVGQMMNSAPAIPRLGIPQYQWWSEALHGVTKPAPCTSFPQCIGLGATWDTDLEFRIATAISDEARARFHDERRRGVERDDLGLDFWAPNINIFRDPRWGRGQETYGEDPYLTGQMAMKFVRGMQGNDPRYFKTIATPKHFAVHSGPDAIRNSFNAVASQRDMWLTYLPAFENAIKDAGAWSVMGAYNRLNGEPACASKFLLEDVLRGRWGFKGYVVSDCGAITNIYADHHFVRTPEEASAIAVKRGCDLECGDSYRALKNAVQQGLIPEREVDQAVARLFEARMRLGLFDSTTPWTDIPMSIVDSPAHKRLAREAAQKSLVLLKNNGSLPIAAGKKIALIGPNAAATDTLLGNYNGSPAHVVSVREGLAAAGAKLTYAKGSDLTEIASLEPIPPSAFRNLKAEYFDNQNLEGSPVATLNVSSIDADWGTGAPAARVGPDHFSVRWSGQIVAPRTGSYTVGITNDDGMRVWLGEKLILDDWSDHAARTTSTHVNLVRGESYNLKVEFYDNGMYASAKLGWALPGDTKFGEAIAAAKAADVVVMVLGLSGSIENETVDRTYLGMPRFQVDLLRAVQQATRKPIILVLVNGSPLTLGPDELNCASILEAWYPGEEGGHAVADAILGKISPAGRMPVTVVKSAKDLPPIADYSMKGRTYRYPGAKPQFPFGFGLSYTKFEYAALGLPKVLPRGRVLSVAARVRNTGSRTSDEVVQVYRHFRNPSKPMPEQQLVAFTRIRLRAGESRTVKLTVPVKALSVLGDDTFLHQERGSIDISIGGGQPAYAKTLKGSVRISG